MNLRQAIQDGLEAKALLENEVLMGAFAAVEEKAIAQWRGSFAEDHDEREQAYWLLHALDQVRTQLQITLDNGTIAASFLEKQQEK
jgi:hypothetical protein